MTVRTLATALPLLDRARQYNQDTLANDLVAVVLGDLSLAALMAWPVLGHAPAPLETLGLLLVMAGLIVAVTTAAPSARKR